MALERKQAARGRSSLHVRMWSSGTDGVRGAARGREAVRPPLAFVLSDQADKQAAAARRACTEPPRCPESRPRFGDGACPAPS